MKRNVFLRIAALVVTVVLFVSVALPMNVWGAGAIGDDYPANLKNAAKDALVDSWNFYNRECTSFCAWRLNSANGVPFTNYYGNVRWGNANHWDDAARSLGIAVNSTPAVGAIAQTDAGTYGHVAWVADVNGNSITIEEYNNWYGAREYSGTGASGVYDRITKDISYFTGGGYRFIHIKDIPKQTENPDEVAFQSSKTAVGKFLCVNVENAKMYQTPSTSAKLASPNVNGTVMSTLPRYITVYADYVGTNSKGERFYHMANNTGLVSDQIGGVYMEASGLSELPASGEFTVSSMLTVNLNIRSSASTSGTKIASAAPGSKIIVKSISGVWASIKFNGQDGYCMVGYLDFHPIYYTVTWVIDGKRETESLPYGTLPTHSAPQKADDGKYRYSFAGWSPKIELVTKDATYTAQFEKETIYSSGDVNADGVIDAFDYQMLKAFVLGTFKDVTGKQKEAMDVNHDGCADAFDYQMVKAHVLGTYVIQ